MRACAAGSCRTLRSRGATPSGTSTGSPPSAFSRPRWSHTCPAPRCSRSTINLWQTCESGSLAEGIAAANWAIEGVTGIWSRGCAEPFRGYAADGVRIDSKSMMWLNAHARYDDAHPDEALEALKIYVDGAGGRRGNPLGVQWAARRALELFAAGVERCYDLGLG